MSRRGTRLGLAHDKHVPQAGTRNATPTEFARREILRRPGDDDAKGIQTALSYVAREAVSDHVKKQPIAFKASQLLCLRL